jgi:hypothetical protein
MAFATIASAGPGVGLFMGQGEAKLRALLYFSGCPNSSTVARDDPLHGCEPHAGSGEFCLRVEALKWMEQPVGIGTVEAGAVVPDEKDYIVAFAPATEFDARRILSRGVFPCIAKQVLEDYCDQTFIGNGHTIVGNDGFYVSLASECQVIENRSRQGAHVDRDILDRCARRP